MMMLALMLTMAQENVGHENLKLKITEILRAANFDLVQADKSLKDLQPDLFGLNRVTGSAIVVEVKDTPILTNVVQALGYYKRRFPKYQFVVFSTKGTYDDVKEAAEKEGIGIFSSLDELEANVPRFTKEPS